LFASVAAITAWKVLLPSLECARGAFLLFPPIVVHFGVADLVRSTTVHVDLTQVHLRHGLRQPLLHLALDLLLDLLLNLDLQLLLVLLVHHRLVFVSLVVDLIMVLGLELTKAFTLSVVELLLRRPFLHGSESYFLTLSSSCLLFEACLLLLDLHQQMLVTVHELGYRALLAALLVFEHILEAVKHSVLGHRDRLANGDSSATYLLGDIGTIEDLVLRSKGRQYDQRPLLVRVVLALRIDPQVPVLQTGGGQKFVHEHHHRRRLGAVLDSDNVMMGHPQRS
jgi:hypothetical protein